MRRPLPTLLFVLMAYVGTLIGGNDPAARFNVVAIKPSSTSIYIGTVSMTMPPFVRRNTVFSSTYSAKVFPYFFYNETGRIYIVIPDDDLRRIDLGKPINFTGSALSESGDKRKVEGRATPTGPSSGTIRVRVFVTRRMALTYDTTYELTGVPRPPLGVTPR